MMSFIISLFGFSNICNAQSKGDLWRDFQNNVEGTYEFKDDYNKQFKLVLIYNYNIKKFLGALYDIQGKEIARGEIFYERTPIANYQFIRSAKLTLNKKVQITCLERIRGNKNYITSDTDVLKFQDAPNGPTLYVPHEPSYQGGNFNLRKVGGIEDSIRKSLMN